MGVRMLFVVGAPRSGTTLLERMLSSHSQILGGPEPHLLTPLAHAGVYAAAESAPYDVQEASAGLRRFVDGLPGGESDYWPACRAYCDVLYGRLLESNRKKVCLDKTPAYALVLPFVAKVFPDAKYVVLTRHPLAMFSSFANSFFDGDYAEAQRYNPVLNRYVPALADFLRQGEVAPFHLRYEDLVREPEAWMERACAYVEVPYEPEMVEYGRQERTGKGLGDPIGVKQHTRPTTQSVAKWVEELAADRGKEALMREVIAQVDAADLATLGYPVETLWRQLEEYTGTPARRKEGMTRYRLQRRAIVRLRNAVQKYGALRKPLEMVRDACEGLLRE